MKKMWKIGASLTATAGLAASIAGFGNTTALAAAADKPVMGGSLVLDTTSNVKDIDPELSYDTTSGEITGEMYESLAQVEYKSTTYKLVPSLATGWKVTNGGKTYTFHIRKGVTFWNGDKMTAQSFVAALERALTKKEASPFEPFFDPIVQGSHAYYEGKAKSISGVSTPNPYTLVIHLIKPEPFFLDVTQFLDAIDPAFINKVGSKNFDTTQAMGTGPFMLKSVTPTQVVLVRNPHYWQKDKYGNTLPYLNQVTINVNKNGQLDALHFEQGQTGILGNMIGIPSAVYPHFITDPTLKKDIYKSVVNNVFYLGFQVNQKPFTNVLVRRALEYAVNKDKILKLINGRGEVANQPLPPGLPGYVKKLPASVNYTYNPAKAKQLLKQAGAHNLSITLYSANDPDLVKIDTSIQNDLQQVGIKAKIDATDWNTFLDLVNKGKTPLYSLGWLQDFPDPSDFLNTLFNGSEIAAGNNTLFYNNKQVNAWLNQAQTDNNIPQRNALYEKVSIKIMKDAVWVPLYYALDVYAVQPWIHNYFLNPNIAGDPLQYIWISK